MHATLPCTGACRTAPLPSWCRSLTVDAIGGFDMASRPPSLLRVAGVASALAGATFLSYKPKADEPTSAGATPLPYKPKASVPTSGAETKQNFKFPFWKQKKELV